MSVSIVYNLFGVGWAECSITIGDTSLRLTASYLSHALADLLQAVVDLLNGHGETVVSFAEEPGEYRWRLQRVDENTVGIKIIEFDNLWKNKLDEEGSVIFEAQCRMRTFAGAVLSASQRELAEHGLEGYREKWANDDFPLELHNELKQLLRNGRLKKQ
jgi:hypothetical protein